MVAATGPSTRPTFDIERITDPEIRAGVRAALEKNLLTAASERQYPGHFTITADGSGYGSDSTWPGLDSWQMAGAYLRLGRQRLVEDYFEFVRASQRKDGNIPFAIFAGNTRPDTTWLRGLKYPDDCFTYAPPKRDGLPESSRQTRTWIGMFSHWQPKANPLSNLAAVCYILTAAEIFDTSKSVLWLKERLPSLERAARYLLSRTADNGLIAGSGFYTELPPRYGFDGITQCYVIHAFNELSRLFDAAGLHDEHAEWAKHATKLSERFSSNFWREDHFGEYVHADPARGLVDLHGLSDVNWAAVAFNIAGDEQLVKLWPRLSGDKGFWAGDMPTWTVTKPAAYEKWEYHEELPFGAPPLKDVAAMGRVWQLEVIACTRMGDKARILESARKVCKAGRDGYWSERYTLDKTGGAVPAYAGKYCEYPAVLVRAVVDNGKVFIS